MLLNADFARRATVHAADLPWSPSPIQGVERRMLDRVGEDRGELGHGDGGDREDCESGLGELAHFENS